MKHYFGLSERGLRNNEEKPVIYSTDALINPHVLICGMSGTGKSTQSLRLLNTVARAGIEADIFDVHDELDRISGAKAIMYSQATGYGFNPLVLNTDPHTGGVNRQIDFFIDLIKEVTPGFGIRQEGVLRNLLLDTYQACWIRQSDPRSWARREITEYEREELVNERKYSELRNFYPTIEDLRSYARRKIVALTIGGDNKCVTAFDQLTRLKNKLFTLHGKFKKNSGDEHEIDRMQGQIDKVKVELVETYTKFLNAMESGREIDDILKYDSVDTLTSVMARIDLLNSTGILRANAPPFGDARVRVHQIKSFRDEQQVLFVKMRLREIFERYKRQGATVDGKEIRHVIFLDEAHKYFSSREDDIINIIAKEARKFGIALWCASQSPTVFPESFLTNCGTTMILGLHSMYWKKSASMLGIEEETLKRISFKETMAIKMQKEGAANAGFISTVVPNPSNDLGKRAIAYIQPKKAA